MQASNFYDYFYSDCCLTAIQISYSGYMAYLATRVRLRSKARTCEESFFKLTGVIPTCIALRGSLWQA